MLVNKATLFPFDKQGNLSRVYFLVGRWDGYQVWREMLVTLIMPSSVNAKK